MLSDGINVYFSKFYFSFWLLNVNDEQTTVNCEIDREY